MNRFHIEFITKISAIEAAQWNRLFDPHYPFTRHEFLAALESSGCTTEDTGWQINHLVVYHHDAPIAAMPCYIKTHSYGEYIFDWSWAEAYEQHGLAYYPKILCAIPYTPATGPRLGVSEHYRSETDEILQLIHQQLTLLAEKIKASNWQCLFADKDLHQRMNNLGWLPRQEVQFHWFNKDYQDFDSFVATFTARKRKNLLKERRAVKQADIDIKVLDGKQITDQLWQQFFIFYQLTYLKRSRRGGYLNQAFFQTLGEVMAPYLMMVVAESGIEGKREVVAASLFFKSQDTLYGRYWGCTESHRFLHFECCYYQGIDYCIEHNIRHFDAGAQGEHKLQRGFEPITVLANYHIRHPQFSNAIADYLKQEQIHIERYIAAAKNQLPYKNIE